MKEKENNKEVVLCAWFKSSTVNGKFENPKDCYNCNGLNIKCVNYFKGGN